MVPSYRHALIVGAGPGLSASCARLFRSTGMAVTLARRNPAAEDGVAEAMAAIGAEIRAVDVAEPASVAALFAALDTAASGAPDVVLFNPSVRARGPFRALDPAEVDRALRISAFGGFLVAHEAVRRMLPEGGALGHGAILFTGASASVKGFAQSAPFAMGKFALRGLAQSLAREMHPKGVHIGHVVIDGAVRSEARGRAEGPMDAAETQDRFLDPDAIARSLHHFLEQDRSAWSWEIEIRPWVERF